MQKNKHNDWILNIFYYALFVFCAQIAVQVSVTWEQSTDQQGNKENMNMQNRHFWTS